MLRRSAILAVAFIAMSSTAWAQTKVQASILFGYTVSDGVSGSAFSAPDGNSYSRVDPKDGGNFGFSFGFMVTPKAELGFMYRRQMSKFVISGPTNTKELGDLNVDGYHGYYAYYFGDPEGAVQPYFLLGLGATVLPETTLMTETGATFTRTSATEFSGTLGTGVQFNAGSHFGIKGGMSWTPTYVKSDPDGYWCGWYGCYVVGNAQYMNQFHFEGAFVFRF
jgi:hypothetical protein